MSAASEHAAYRAWDAHRHACMRCGIRGACDAGIPLWLAWRSAWRALYRPGTAREGASATPAALPTAPTAAGPVLPAPASPLAASPGAPSPPRAPPEGDGFDLAAYDLRRVARWDLPFTPPPEAP